MSQADELLNGLSEEEISEYSVQNVEEGHIIIDPITRTITVPEQLKKIAVQYDHNVETVTFDCPRYWDGNDLSKMTIYVNYAIKNNTINSSYIVTNMCVDEEDSSLLHFDWTISRNVTTSAGQISFLVCAKQVDDEGNETRHWNSEINSDMYISAGLEGSESIEEEYPDVLTNFDNRITDNADKIAELEVHITNEVTDLDNKFSSVITERTSENILDPKLVSCDDWYYSTTDGETIISKPGNVLFNTVEKIKLPKTTSKVYVSLDTTATPTTYGVIIYSYDDNGFLGMFAKTIEKNISIPVDVCAGATHIRLYCNESRDPNIRFCITLDPVTEFKEYGKNIYIDANKIFGLENRDLPFTGKTIVNFGDSIYGGKRPPYDISTALANITGATVHNCGFGGCRMAQHDTSANWDAFSMYRIAYAIANNDFTLQDNALSQATDLPSYFAETVTLLKSLDFANVDIITIGYGINDHSKENALDSDENPKDVTTFAGALRYSIETILSAFPNLKIFICGQTYRAWLNSDHTLNEDSDTKLNEVGVKLTEFVAKTEEVSKEYHLKFIDNYYSLGINKFNRSHWFPATDGVHHNTLGAELIANHIASELF